MFSEKACLDFVGYLVTFSKDLSNPSLEYWLIVYIFCLGTFYQFHRIRHFMFFNPIKGAVLPVKEKLPPMFFSWLFWDRFHAYKSHLSFPMPSHLFCVYIFPTLFESAVLPSQCLKTWTQKLGFLLILLLLHQGIQSHI